METISSDKLMKIPFNADIYEQNPDIAVITRKGLEVKFIKIHYNDDEYPVTATIINPGGNIPINSYFTLNGRFDSDETATDYDLFFIVLKAF